MILTELAADFTDAAAVEHALHKVQGVQRVRINKDTQSIIVEGTCAPSVLQHTLQPFASHVIVRGTSASDTRVADALAYDQKAAVCIFDTSAQGDVVQPLGLVRLIQTTADSCFLDASLTSLQPDTAHSISVHEVSIIRSKYDDHHHNGSSVTSPKDAARWETRSLIQVQEASRLNLNRTRMAMPKWLETFNV